jgi:hypothetical protein
MDKQQIIRKKYELIKDQQNERSRRIWAANEAIALGHGGITIVSEATHMAKSTIAIGKKELLSITDSNPALEKTRIRRKGGGRKKLEDLDSGLLKELDSLVDPETRGDPESLLRWTTKSTRKLAAAMCAKGFSVSHVKVADLLKQADYSLQAPRKTNEGKSHPDRDAQFRYINFQSAKFQKQGLPVVSVDAKKKELVGKFMNSGQEYQPKSSPEEVNVYDFPSLANGKVTPYGVYDIAQNKGWVNVGISKDTSQFAVSTLHNWWTEMGCDLYPGAKKLLVHADGGGSNGHRNRLWKVELQKFAKHTGLEVTVCHFPPGTSKWNKIEHRLFAQISKNWRGRPLESVAIIVSLIGATTTTTGLTVKVAIDPKEYQGGIKVSDKEFNEVNIQRHSFHGEDWNYTIKPS